MSGVKTTITNEYVHCGSYVELHVASFLGEQKIKEYVSKIDAEDYERIRRMRWRFSGTKQWIYLRSTGKRSDGATRLHRFLVGAPTGSCVDHINHDTLDNRKSNLRIVSASLNQVNRKQVFAAGPSARGRYRPSLSFAGTRFELGLFTTFSEAKAAKMAARRMLEKMLASGIIPGHCGSTS